MLRMAVTCLIVAMIASLFGFGLIGEYAYDGAKVVFAVFLVVAVFSFIADAFSGRQMDPV